MKLPLPKKASQKKRLREWESWLDNFFQQNLNKKGKGSFSYIPNAAWLLNELYWRLIEQYIRPVLHDDHSKERLIHPYKIISVSEITVMMTEPIKFLGDLEKEKKYNALFAWFVATQIMEGWDTGNTIKIKAEHINSTAEFKEHITKTTTYPESFALEHIKWLIELNVTIEKPLALNAQCWRMFYLCCLALAGKGHLK